MGTQKSQSTYVGDSAQTSRGPRLNIRMLEAKIPVKISENLQMQIMTLCGKLPRVEWSGTLFYKVQGEFGEPEFSIEAHELYLLDIGSAAYTEYETNDPEFYQMLMTRPDLREMRMGHIHSHNAMDSFFSGTDDGELVENSEFHNYYFSLIVNNENEMVAKVAFRAQVDSETNASMKFKGTDGQLKEKHMTTKNQTTHVYAYGCDITVPRIVSTTEAALARHEQKEQERKESERKSKYGSHSIYGGVVYSGRLFGEPGDQEIKEEEELVEETRSQKKASGAWARKRASRPLNRKSVEFLVKLLKVDKEAEGKIEDILEEVVGDMYRENRVVEYFDTVSKKLLFLYQEVFPGDIQMKDTDDIIMDCMDLLDLYADTYPVFTERMSEVLTKHLTPLSL